MDQNPKDDSPNRWDDEERRYCDELQRRMLEYELNPANFLRLQKSMMGGRNAPYMVNRGLTGGGSDRAWPGTKLALGDARPK